MTFLTTRAGKLRRPSFTSTTRCKVARNLPRRNTPSSRPKSLLPPPSKPFHFPRLPGHLMSSSPPFFAQRLCHFIPESPKGRRPDERDERCQRVCQCCRAASRLRQGTPKASCFLSFPFLSFSFLFIYIAVMLLFSLSLSLSLSLFAFFWSAGCLKIELGR